MTKRRRRTGMGGQAAACLVATVTIVLSSAAPAEERDGATPGPAGVACSYGPLPRAFGGTNWIVYACTGADEMIVVVTPRGHPAYFSYVLVRWRDGAPQTHAEGQGDAKAREAARRELSRLSRDDFRALRDAATRKGDEAARQKQRVAAAPPAGLAESPNAFPYRTVAATREALEKDPHVTFSTKSGWSVAVDARSTQDTGATVWSFTPPGHPAYPAVVRRQPMRNRQNDISLSLQVLCEAAKAPCDDLVREFKALNERVADDLKKRFTPPRDDHR